MMKKVEEELWEKKGVKKWQSVKHKGIFRGQTCAQDKEGGRNNKRRKGRLFAILQQQIKRGMKSP